MSYIFYSITFFLLITVTGLYYFRSHWLPYLPDRYYSRLPASFASDIESGFTSRAFDLSANVEAGDSRAGLDDRGKKEIQKIMSKRKVDFDEARRIWTEARFQKNNIGPDGLPRDPKFVSFS